MSVVQNNTISTNSITEATSSNGVSIDGLKVKDSALVTDTNKYAFVKGGELNSLGYLNRNFFGVSYYLSTSAAIDSSNDTALTTANGFAWTKQASSGSSGSDDSDIFGRFSGGTFTGGVSGYYLVIFNASSTNVIDDAEYVELSVKINGSTMITLTRSYSPSGNQRIKSICSGVAALDTNDTLIPYIFHNEGTGHQFDVTVNLTNFSVFYLGTSDL